jgi:predicted transcriptional regulator
MSNELMSKRVSVVLPDDVGEILEEMAKEERRSHSQMGAILIEEAIAARIAQQNGTPTTPGSKGRGKKGGEE